MLATLKHTFRQLARSPLFTTVTVMTLALGLGANAAIFTRVRSILLRDLPYAQQQELVSVALVDPSGANLPHGISGPEYRQLTAAAKTLKSVAVYSPQWNVTVQGAEQTSGEFALYVSGNFFATLGVPPTLGRALTAGDDRAEAAPVVVVSDSFWRRYLNASPAALGANVLISGTAMTVVGIMPASFEFGETVNCWMPMAKNPYNTLARVRLFSVFGRLADGATATQATAETNALFTEFAKTNNNPLGPRAPLVTNLHEQIIRRVRPALLAIQAAGALLLAATCANLLLLLFARHSAREREFGVRLALGASPLQIARLIISETTALALLGGGLGLFLAKWTLDGLLAFAPAGLLPRRPEIGLDSTVLLFAGTLALGGAILVGALAAWRRRNTELNSVLKSGGRSPSSASATSRSALVIA
jgi:putative ABC transport system permease protein